MGITIKEIARKSGYGVGTVSRALNSSPYLIKDETRKKIIKIAKKYGYIKDVSAQALVTGKSTDIGLVIPAKFKSPYYSDFYMKVISGSIDALSEYGYKLRVLFLRGKTGLHEIMQESKALKIGGLILSPYCRDYFIEAGDIKKLNMPVVLLGKDIRGENIRSIVLDDFKGGYDGTEYLIRLGHRRIGIIRGQLDDIETRFSGCVQAMKDNGIKTEDGFFLVGDGKKESGYKLAFDLMEKKNRPTAIFALDDEMAYGAVTAIKEKKLKCPEDVSVLGFDGIDSMMFMDPRLTTIVRPVSYMGEQAVKLLIDGYLWKKRTCIKVQGEIEERESCGKRKGG
ncbi:MAG: LacI family DNA-binding transcriptional regulator [Candidatus Omnitrophota bacterium]